MVNKQDGSTFKKILQFQLGALNELKWWDFFFDFMKQPPLQLTAGEYAFKLSVLSSYLRDNLEADTFRIRLVHSSCFPFSTI